MQDSRFLQALNEYPGFPVAISTAYFTGLLWRLWRILIHLGSDLLEEDISLKIENTICSIKRSSWVKNFAMISSISGRQLDEDIAQRKEMARKRDQPWLISLQAGM